MLAKLKTNLKKDFESIRIKLKYIFKLILFSTSILQGLDLQIKLWYIQLKNNYMESSVV